MIDRLMAGRASPRDFLIFAVFMMFFAMFTRMHGDGGKLIRIFAITGFGSTVVALILWAFFEGSL